MDQDDRAEWALRASEVTRLLRAAEEQVWSAQQARATFVADARRAGLSWSETGRLLGVSAERARQISGLALPSSPS